MTTDNIYKDIALRTGGDIYLGVVGPVRSGKSTFIKRFMDLLVLPNIDNPYTRERARDELPQSAAGRSVMTTEPKFVPEKGAEIALGEGVACRVRLIDCVGYPVEGAEGYREGDAPRMVSTPWSEEKIPFVKAAEIGTRKVIEEHSTVGLVITTDGTIGELPREGYIPAEERVITELRGLNKPFVVLLNSARPHSEEALALAQELKEKYSVPVTPVNCAQLREENITALLEELLYEFPVSRVDINLPPWVEALPTDHRIKAGIIETLRSLPLQLKSLREISLLPEAIAANEYVKKALADRLDPATGCATIEVSLEDNLFYQELSQTTDMEITDEYQLISTIKELAKAKKAYDKVRFALEQVNMKGYGVVVPSPEEAELSSPQVVKQGGKYGVRITASAPSIHMIRADITTTLSPVVGSQEQSEELAQYLAGQLEGNKAGLWSYNIFGRSLSELVKEDLSGKVNRMPEDAQDKFRQTLEKIINEGSGGMICILL